MKTIPRLHFAPLFALALLLLAPLRAGTAPQGVSEDAAPTLKFDPESPLSPFDQAMLTVATLAAQAKADETLRDDPDHAPSSRTPGSPAASSIAASVVENAGLSEAIGVALDSAFGTGDPDQAITFSLSPFAFVAATHPEALARNSEYLKYRGLRRIEGSLTLGGKPDEMPAAEGDDMASGDEGDGDPPATPEATRRITDIVIVQAKVRLVGSRDRRDHWREYQLGAVSHAKSEYTRVARDVARDPDLDLAGGGAEQYDRLVKQFRGKPTVVEALRSTYEAFDQSIKDVNDRIDHGLLVTLEVTGEFRRAAVGRDKLMIGLLAERGGSSFDFTANARFRSDEKLGSAERTQELQLGAQLAKKILRESVLTRDGFDLSLSALGQFRNEDRDDLISVTTKLDFPIGDGLRIPVSVTWASQSDLIDESIVRGNFGLSYDLSALKRTVDGS